MKNQRYNQFAAWKPLYMIETRKAFYKMRRRELEMNRVSDEYRPRVIEKWEAARLKFRELAEKQNEVFA